ncbi:arginase family protein [Ancrocorticia populi]|uniref:Arginase n=1 Tax=Ancrocorticia populi TaxID=2175228 RepID=A0A2V1K6R5_9ACTO|nr:arginase family protein [Ancrocorticia populi]PWF27158.1 arginase [Ancrocorticia populi]
MTSAQTLRLIWPQWQGAGSENYPLPFNELPSDQARLGYAVGTKVIEATLPPHSGPTETVPVPMNIPDDEGSGGIENREILLEQLQAANALLKRHDPERIFTVGGDCSVSVAPFSWLAGRYGSDLAMVWIDSHPDVGTPESDYPGYHAMAVSALLGKVDAAFTDALPALLDPSKIALAGLHSWTADDFPNIASWGLSSFSPEDLRDTSDILLNWLAGTGASKVAIHFDVDTVDANQVQLGLGFDEGGLLAEQARRVIDDIAAAYDVVGLTVAEFIPRNVMFLQNLLGSAPLTN